MEAQRIGPLRSLMERGVLGADAPEARSPRPALLLLWSARYAPGIHPSWYNARRSGLTADAVSVICPEGSTSTTASTCSKPGNICSTS